MKILLVTGTALCFLLVGCVSPSATLSDSSGNTITCSSAGFGLITGEIARHRFNDCVDDAQKKGYKIERTSA